MDINELTYQELLNVNGGSEASDALFYLLGRGLHDFWNALRDMDMVLLMG